MVGATPSAVSATATPVFGVCLGLQGIVEHFGGELGVMGYPLHGQDISLDVTPVQARMAWAVGWDKPAFWGRDVLVRERADKPARVLRGIVATGRGLSLIHI